MTSPSRNTGTHRDRAIQSPLVRIWTGVVLFAVIFIGAVFGFRMLGDYDLVDAIWMTTITISSVGFSESSDSPPGLQLFTIAVIVLGMSAAAYTFGGFLQMVLEGELQDALGQRRMTRGIEELEDHVIVCGFGRLGEVLAKDLQFARQSFVIVDNAVERYEGAKEMNCLCMLGDATDDEVLSKAGIDRAKSLVSVLPSDADNVFITLTARNLQPAIQIIARAGQSTTEKKLRLAGADKVVMPATIGAHRMERLITRPSTAHLMELVGEASFLDVEVDELRLTDGCKLIGLTVVGTQASRKHHVLVIAVDRVEGGMVFNPDADYTFQKGDVAIVMGRVEDIREFRDTYELPTATNRPAL
jgi:voltage-gated potassium channel